MSVDKFSDNAVNYEFEGLQFANNYRAAVLEEFYPFLKGDVIEVGAGLGQFTQMLKTVSAIKKIVSIEPYTPFCEQFRRNHPDVELINGTINDIDKRTNWDAIVSVNVLEHIADDEAELRIYYNFLKARQGFLCLFTPARTELYSKIDRLFGHYRRYTKKMLREKLESTGFNVIRLHYFNFVGYFGWGLIFKMLGTERFEPSAVKNFDKYILPVVHFIESKIARPPIGQSLVAIAQAIEK